MKVNVRGCICIVSTSLDRHFFGVCVTVVIVVCDGGSVL